MPKTQYSHLFSRTQIGPHHPTAREWKFSHSRGGMERWLRSGCASSFKALIAAGGFEPDTAEQTIASGTVDAVAFGRHFVSNPDLAQRIREGLPLDAYDRSSFHSIDERGYTDYPVYEAVLQA